MLHLKKTPPKSQSEDPKKRYLQTKIEELDEQIKVLEDRLQASQRKLDGATEEARTRPGENPKGGAKRMKSVTADLLKENNSIKKELASVKARRARLAERKRTADIKNKYHTETGMNGGITMGNVYTDDDVKQAKLKIYESCSKGVITKDQRDGLLQALAESVEEYNENVDRYLAEQAAAGTGEGGLDFNAMKVFVYESADKGLISEDEKEYLLSYL